MYNFPNVSLMVSANLSGHVFFYFFILSHLLSPATFMRHIYITCIINVKTLF